MLVYLRSKFFFQNHERLHLAGAHFFIEAPQPPPYEELLYQRLTLRRDVRLGTSVNGHMIARPDQPRGFTRIASYPGTAPLIFQAGLPANVALPTGLVGEFKVEGDN
jgi:hypothetical protein